MILRVGARRKLFRCHEADIWGRYHLDYRWENWFARFVMILYREKILKQIVDIKRFFLKRVSHARRYDRTKPKLRFVSLKRTRLFYYYLTLRMVRRMDKWARNLRVIHWENF